MVQCTPNGELCPALGVLAEEEQLCWTWFCRGGSKQKPKKNAENNPGWVGSVVVINACELLCCVLDFGWKFELVFCMLTLLGTSMNSWLA